MSIFFRASEQRAASYQDAWLSGNPMSSGSLSVERLVPLYGAHRLIIDSVASTPLHGYREDGDGLLRRLSRQPALLTTPPWGTPFTWKAQYAASMLSDGNAFGYVTSFDSTGWPASLMWMCPYDVEVDETGATPRYEYNGVDVTARMVHIPWIVPAGKFRGISPLKAFKTAWETGVSAQQTARDWFVGGAIPSGHLKNTNGSLDQTQSDAAKARFKAAVQGRDVFVSGDDWDYTTIGVPADEARFIEAIRMTATQVAVVYGIPPEEIGGESGGSSLTYATLEQNDIKLSKRTVKPWAVRLEEALTRVMPRPQYAKFNLDADIRTDLKSRMEAHEIAQRAGVRTNEEVRRLEDLPPLTTDERAAWLEAWRNQQPEAAPPQEGTPDAPSA